VKLIISAFRMGAVGGSETYVLTVTSGNLLLGQVTGGGVYPAGAPAEIRAIPASYATFLRWNDGNTDNPRTVIMNSNLEFVAEFGAAQTYTITVLSSNEEMGQVFGGGSQMRLLSVPLQLVTTDCSMA
jgi:hypothetical protein